jgi:hypothetical protein
LAFGALTRDRSARRVASPGSSFSRRSFADDPNGCNRALMVDGGVTVYMPSVSFDGGG